MRIIDWGLALLTGLLRRVGLVEGPIARDDVRRLGILFLVSALCSVFVVDYAPAPNHDLSVGDIAPRTVKAPLEFTYFDHEAHEQAREAARQALPPVYVHQADLLTDRDRRIADAFESARARLRELSESGELDETAHDEVIAAFLAPLRVELPSRDLEALWETQFDQRAENEARRLLDRAMKGRLIVLTRGQLPPDRRPITLIHFDEGVQTEESFSDLQSVMLPEEARQEVSLGVIESGRATSPQIDAAAELARSLVTANLTFDTIETEERRAAAANAVPLELRRVKRGQTIFRGGEPVSKADLDVYRALQTHHAEQDVLRELLAIGMFLLLLLGALWRFAVTQIPSFSTQVKDVAAAGALLVFVAFLVRLVVTSSESVAQLVGYEAEPQAVWFLVPVGGAAMLVRLLISGPWAGMFAVATAAVAGLAMDMQALPILFFLISGIAAASSVERARERIGVLRAGLTVGVVNAVALLLILVVQLVLLEGEVSLAATMRPVWSVSFGFLGAILGAFLVLGILPIMESFGFVTDYRLLELANLNHPLLRQLMLRAPGSYHHSVIVGTLAEAGCEAIGANALLAKVAAYFHDVGKAAQPQYFVENQRGNVNGHNALAPHDSARIIISHVVEGGRMAREHSLPQPILDNIYMHHGTGILQYFYKQALEQAADPSRVEESAFRYPGPKPSNREAGVIMLADKVEAATRTLQQPDAAHIRSMIHRIVNSVISDGQFSECPLNLEEIHTITETFVSVLEGIYHQRIEYPQTADISRGAPPPASATITLDLVPGADPPAEPEDVDDDETDAVDYEALDYLPRAE